MLVRARQLVVLVVLLALGIAAAFVPPEAAHRASDAALPRAGATHLTNDGDTAYLLGSSAMVLLMTPGLSLFYGGMVRDKNVVATMFLSFVAMGVLSLTWIVVGFSLTFGEDLGGVLGHPGTYFLLRGVGPTPDPALSATLPLTTLVSYHMKFAILTPAIMSGSFVERVDFFGYLLFIVLFSLVVYCPLAHMVWHPAGLLAANGITDYAGGVPVHMASGFCALVGAKLLGPRSSVHSPFGRRGGAQGTFASLLGSTAGDGGDDGAGSGGSKPSRLRLWNRMRGWRLPRPVQPPSNIPLVILGTSLLWFGWFAFNGGAGLMAGEYAAQALLTTNASAATAMITWVVLDKYTKGHVGAVGACVAVVVGMVGVTPMAGWVTVTSAMCVGVVSALCSFVAAQYKAHTAVVDDTLDVFACHGVAGMVGMLLVPLLEDVRVNPNAWAAQELGRGGALGRALLAVVCIGAYTSLATWVLFRFVQLLRLRMRVSKRQERLGLDVSLHREVALKALADVIEEKLDEDDDDDDDDDEEAGGGKADGGAETRGATGVVAVGTVGSRHPGDASNFVHAWTPSPPGTARPPSAGAGSGAVAGRRGGPEAGVGLGLGLGLGGPEWLLASALGAGGPEVEWPPAAAFDGGEREGMVGRRPRTSPPPPARVGSVYSPPPVAAVVM